MRLSAVALIVAYAGLFVFGLGMLSHGEHNLCPFGGFSGDCAILGSLGSTLNHLEAFQLALLALPIFFVIFFFAAIWNEAADIVPSVDLLRHERGRAEDFFPPRRRIFYRWSSLISSYS